VLHGLDFIGQNFRLLNRKNTLFVVAFGGIITALLYPISKLTNPDRDFEVNTGVEVSDLYSDRRKSDNMGAFMCWIMVSWAWALSKRSHNQEKIMLIQENLSTMSRILQTLLAKRDKIPIKSLKESDADDISIGLLMNIRNILFVNVNGPHLKFRLTDS